MKAVGIRELKAHLSRFLREVASGEVVLVTDRGRVVAEMRPPAEVAWRESDVDRRLRRLADRGSLHLEGPHDAAAYVPSPVRCRPGTARALLEAERDER